MQTLAFVKRKELKGCTEVEMCSGLCQESQEYVAVVGTASADRARAAGIAGSLYGTRDNLSESRFRAVQLRDDPTNDCGSGADTLED